MAVLPMVALHAAVRTTMPCHYHAAPRHHRLNTMQYDLPPLPHNPTLEMQSPHSTDPSGGAGSNPILILILTPGSLLPLSQDPNI